LKLRLPFDLLEPEHFRVQDKKSTGEPEDQDYQQEKEKKQREL
jgi:hypothetical protein